MTLKSLLLPAFCAALLSAPAFAGPAAAPASRMVEIDRAALLTEAGARETYADITAAAHAACRAENRGGAAYERRLRLCVDDTLARTVEALDAPSISALHQRREAVRQLASIG